MVDGAVAFALCVWRWRWRWQMAREMGKMRTLNLGLDIVNGVG